MFGSCAAAPAYQLDTGRHKLAGITCHVLGRAQVNVPSFYGTGDSRVRLGGDGSGGGGSKPFDGIEHRNRTHAAVTADNIGAPVLNAGAEDLGSGPVEASGFFIHRDLRDHGNRGIKFTRSLVG